MSVPSHRQPPPTAEEIEAARTAGRLLAPHARGSGLTLRVTGEEQGQPIELPAGAVSMLMDVLEAMAEGRGVMLIPDDAELTAVEAAELLNVSRPYLIKLLEAGELPFRKAGTHWRVRMQDVLAHKQRTDQRRAEALDALVADAQALRMGYDDE